jgi:hypothetical protein
MELKALGNDESLRLMHEETNRCNLQYFDWISPLFFYEDLTYEKIEKGIKYRRPLDNDLLLDEQKRRWFSFEHIDPKNDTSFQLFCELMWSPKIKSVMMDKLSDMVPGPSSDRSSALVTVEREILYKNIFNHTTFSSGKIKFGNQEYKLFKWLKKNKILGQAEIEAITAARPPKQRLYFCISRNPVDYLFCSTHQSFTSCLDLNSTHSDAYYMGLGALASDDNRFMCFTSNGKLRRYAVLNHEFKHFRKFTRSFGLAGISDEYFLVKAYPNGLNALEGLLQSALKIIQKEHSKVNPLCFSVPKVRDPEDFEKSRYPLFLPRYCTSLDHNFAFPYLDEPSHFAPAVDDENDNYGLWLNPKSLKQSHYKRYSHIYAVTGDFDWGGGFDQITCVEDLVSGGGERYMCYSCGNGLAEDEGYYECDNLYCEECYHELFSVCENCSEVFWREDGYYDDHAGYEYCDVCFGELFFYCRKCSESFPTEEAIHVDDDLYCEDCTTELFFCCEECEEWFDQDTVFVANESLYCEECAKKLEECE